MADNVQITAGSGTSIATDDVGGIQYQRVKAAYGADGVGTDVKGSTPLPVDTDSRRTISFRGRACSFKTPGRAAVSQKLMSIHNATGSSVLVDVNRIRVDVLSTVVKAITVVVPVIRIYRYTTVQTNGSVLTKGAVDSLLGSNASVTVTGDASADVTGSTTTLTITPTTMLAQVYAPRWVTAAGIEQVDTVEFFVGETDITLRALEGLVVFLEAAVVTTGIPATDNYICSIDWTEYTLAA